MAVYKVKAKKTSKKRLGPKGRKMKPSKIGPGASPRVKY